MDLKKPSWVCCESASIWLQEIAGDSANGRWENIKIRFTYVWSQSCPVLAESQGSHFSLTHYFFSYSNAAAKAECCIQSEKRTPGVLPRPQPHCSGQAVVKKATTPQILGLCCCYVRISDFGSRVCSIVLGGHTGAQTSDGIDIVVISGLCGRPVDWWGVIFYEFPHLIWTWNSGNLESHC